MKHIHYITISLFIAASLLIGSISYGQIAALKDFSFETFQRATEGYKPQQKFDTVKVRILYDLGGNIPACKTGWIVRQWYTYYIGIDLHNCIDCPPPPSDKWFDTEILLSEDKKTKIDKAIVWQYKQIP